MLLLADTISRLRTHWNKRPLTEVDFYRLCRKHKVSVEEMPLRVSGFYYCAMGRHFIAIDSRLSPQKKLFVMFTSSHTIFCTLRLEQRPRITMAWVNGRGSKLRRIRLLCVR